MRLIAATLLAALVTACGSGGSPAGGEVRLRVRLENHDSHLYDVTAVDLDLKRDNVLVHDRLSAPSGQLLEFPVEVIVQVPIGAGPLVVEAIARGENAVVLGGGEGQVTATAGSIAMVTIGLLSDRNRPSRGRMGAGSDGGMPEDAAPPPPDVANPPEDAAVPIAPDAAAVPCTPHTRHLLAQTVTSVDWGPEPRDSADNRVAVSSGFAHNHIHDFVAWMRFDLREVPDGARLTSAALSVVLIRPPTLTPQLAILYSAVDDWNPETLTSNTAELVPRTARISGDLGPPQRARGQYAIDPALYAPHFTADLTDDAVTLGLISTTPPMEPEAWADFYGLEPMNLAPALDLVTCE